MSNKQQKHTIEHQIINLQLNGIDDDQEIRDIQQSIIYFFKSNIGEAIDKILTRLCPPDVDITIDKLELNLDDITFNSTNELRNKLTRTLEETLKKAVKKELRKISKKTKGSSSAVQQISKVHIVEHFLLYGHFPSWASKRNGTIQEIFRDLLKKQTNHLLRVIIKHRRSKAVQERLFQQFKTKDLELLIQKLYSKESKALQQIKLLQKRLGNNSKKAVLSAAINFAFRHDSPSKIAKITERSFARSIIEEVQGRTITINTPTKVRAGFAETYKDIQILEYFLDYGAIPYWADVENKKSFKELFRVLLGSQLIKVQRLIERKSNNPRFIQRLILQFDTEDILVLLEPTPGENIQFIMDSIHDFEFLANDRTLIKKKISKHKIRETILLEALDYFFVKGKNRFIKQSFLKNVLAELADLAQTDYNIVLKESYKYVRRRKKDTAIKSTLENLDANLKTKLNKDKQELRTAQKELRSIERSLQQLQKKLSEAELNPTQISSLKKEQQRFQRKLNSLEKQIAELSDEDMPLDIEIVLQQRQLLRNQMERTEIEEERQKIGKRLEKSNKEFKKLQDAFQKDLAKIIKEQERLKSRTGTISDKRQVRLENRLKKHQRAVQNIIAQLNSDEKNLVLFLADIRGALRQAKTATDRRKLRKERDRIESELVDIRKQIAQLQEQQAILKTQLAQTKKSPKEVIKEEVSSNDNTSKLDYLIFFLKYGSMPWWAEPFKKQSIEDIFVEFANNSPQKLRKAFQTVGKFPIIWERVILQLSEEAIQLIIKKTYASNADVIFAQADILFTIQYSESFEKLKKINTKQFKWLLILEYLLSGSQTFREQKFVKDITLLTAKKYSLLASTLVEYSHNIAKNRSSNPIAKSFADWTEKLKKDEEVAEADRDLISKQREITLAEQGLLLSNEQKITLLGDFLTSGTISEAAKNADYKSVASFENLLLEQIQKNKAQAKHIVHSLLKLIQTRQIILNQFSEDTFWEIILLVDSPSLLLIKRYFKDFQFLFEDKKLLAEKEILLNFLISNKFNIIDFLQAILLFVQQKTNRKALPILASWKRKLLKQPTAASSLVLPVFELEINLLKEQQKETEEVNLQKNIAEQVEFLTERYLEESKKIHRTLSEESAEEMGIPLKEYTLLEINQTITALQKQIDTLEKNLDKVDLMQQVNDRRQLIRLKAQIKLYELQKPPLLRLLEKQISEKQRKLERINKEIAQQPAVDLEPLSPSQKREEALVERQVKISLLIQKKSTLVISLLDQLLTDLEDSDHSHYLFLEHLQDLLTDIGDPNYTAPILVILDQHKKNIPSLQQLQQLATPKEELTPTEDKVLSQEEKLTPQKQALAQLQQSILQKMPMASSFELWKDWDNLQDFYQNNKGLQSQQAEELHQHIFAYIKRKHLQNLLLFTNNMQQLRELLTQKLDQANDLETLDEIQNEITALWKRQTEEIKEILAAAREGSIRKDFEKLQKNLPLIFADIQNQRIEKSNQLRSQGGEKQRTQKSGFELELQELRQQKHFILDEIKRKEKPLHEFPKKKKRKKAKEAPEPPKIDEPLQIYNAGLVLLWPYVSRLFKMFKLVDGKNFVSEEAQFKAIHLLQYLATGQLEAPENELVLNKVFCGLPLSTPVPLAVDISPQELQIADSLLLGAAKNWPKMKTMTPPAFRANFLIREGTIKEEVDKWFIVVKKQPFDILLKSLPWGYSFIQFPWVDRFIKVEWPLM